MTKDYDESSLLDNMAKLSVISIGPFTSDELKKFKIKNTISQVHTVLGVFDTLKSIFSIM
jgi:uroporphyrinogen-III synthase